MLAPPNPQTLIPPLLAVLPTSFASSKPPPTLLALLSPILQQRLQIHTSTGGSEHDSWLRLLCWDKAKAEKLKEIVENANFEPHPSSGEIEVGEVDTITYKRFDAETLRAQIPLPDWEVTVMYLWCMGGDADNAWKVAELLPFDSDLIKAQGWTATLDQVASRPPSTRPLHSKSPQPLFQRNLSTQGDDDNYWAMYDNSPSGTPAQKGSAIPALGAVSEDDYFARYAEVQPAMDNDDPDEMPEGGEQSSLNGNALQQMLAAHTQHATSNAPADPGEAASPRAGDSAPHISQPTPSPPASRAGSDTVSRLEETADRYSSSDIAIRQHISTTMKSMYRLAKAAGIPRDDFESMVQRELETLSILDAHV